MSDSPANKLAMAVRKVGSLPVASPPLVSPPLPPASKTPHAAWRDTSMVVAAVVGASLVALVSGTPNAFNSIAGEIQAATGTTNIFISTMTGLGVAGLFISLPAGVLSDSYGTPIAAVVGGTAIVGGYFAMSFVGETPMLLLVSNAVVGLGSGCTFLAALSTAISTRKSWAIALVSLCMSLSISFTVLLVSTYDKHYDCVPSTCWIGYVRMLAAVCGGAIVVGALGMKAGQTDSDPGSAPRERALSMDGDISCCQSLHVMKRVDFWLLFLSNIVGIGGGVFIVTSLAQVWDNFSTPSEKVWGRRIVIMFSVCNAVGNVVSPIVSERLHRQGKMRRSTFTAWVLGAMAVIFSALGTFTVVPGLRDGPWACDVAYIALMASVGFGYGSFLTLFPTLVAETYGLRNFGTYVSYIQMGSALSSILIPAATTAIFASTHVYSPMHFLMAGLQILGCVFMACGHFKSLSFGVDAGKLPREKSGMSAIDEDAPMTTATARLLSSSKLPKRANDDRDSRCAQARSRSVGAVEDGGTSTMDGFPFQAF